MPRPILARLFIACIFAIAAFAAPGEAVAHGVSHHEAHESGHHAVAADVSQGVVVGAADHEHEHGHPQLDSGTRSRFDGLTLPPILAAHVPEVRTVRRPDVAPFHRATLARGDPRTGPPPRLRAPPAR